MEVRDAQLVRRVSSAPFAGYSRRPLGAVADRFSALFLLLAAVLVSARLLGAAPAARRG